MVEETADKGGGQYGDYNRRVEVMEEGGVIGG